MTAGAELRSLVKLMGPRSRPELSWVAQVVGCDREEAEDATNELLGRAADIRSLSDRIARTGRSYYAQFPAPFELYSMVRLVRPGNLVESGVASGVSSAFMLMGIKANRRGTLHSIDKPVPRKKGPGNESWAIPAGHSSGWAVPPALRRRWDLRLGRSEDVLEDLLGETGVLDFYCHDSPVDEAHLKFEMEAIRPHLRSGSLVVSDNTGEIGTFDRLAKAMGTTSLRRRTSTLQAFRVP